MALAGETIGKGVTGLTEVTTGVDLSALAAKVGITPINKQAKVVGNQEARGRLIGAIID
jgi:hypothetical protein